MADWLWQTRGVESVLAAIARDQRRLVLTSPTGMGKTRTAGLLVEHYLDRMQRVVVYANRKILIRQLSDMMEAAGHVHGVRAADHFPEHHHPFQISSIQTEGARSLRGNQELHPADLVIFDEGHLHTSGQAKEIADWHLERGTTILYLTATPVGMSEVADEIVVAGTKAEGREHGALVLAHHYGPDEPDTRNIGLVSPGDDFSEEQARKVMGAVNDKGMANKRLVQLFGRVGQHYLKLNPLRKPALLFAPGVRESMWFVDRFVAIGVSAAHIDGEGIYYGQRDDDGFPIVVPTSEEAREQLREESRTGKVQVISNRFVMREGIDFPWIEHLILATVLGSIQGYVQVGGRGLRAYPGKSHCIIQDHAGLWWRHGSLNADIEWHLNETSHMLGAARFDDLREHRVAEPFCCPQCNMILSRRACPCGFKIDPTRRTRPVLMQDGELVQLGGPIVKPRRRYACKDTLAIWKQCYFRARNSKSRMTFAQAEGLFVKEAKHWPPRTLPFMPKKTIDFYRPVADVPPAELKRQENQ